MLFPSRTHWATLFFPQRALHAGLAPSAPSFSMQRMSLPGSTRSPFRCPQLQRSICSSTRFPGRLRPIPWMSRQRVVAAVLPPRRGQSPPELRAILSSWVLGIQGRRGTHRDQLSWDCWRTPLHSASLLPWRQLAALSPAARLLARVCSGAPPWRRFIPTQGLSPAVIQR